MKSSEDSEGMILIVDDDLQNVEVVGNMLVAFGYDFMVAKDGIEAVGRVKARLPDLVLLDVQLPNMDGFEVCKAFREVEGMSEVPIIFLSAKDEKNFIVKALEVGGVDYVTKPFNKAELLARVRTHIELKSIRDERAKLLANTERFLEIMAHDLKNWIGSAHFSSQLLAGQADLPENALKIANTVKDATGHTLDFIKDFLTNAREAKTELDLNLRPFDLNQLGKELVALYEEGAQRKQITVACEFPESEYQLTSDRLALRRILENLLSNAIKFSPEGGKVTLRISPDSPSLSVSDEGPGFSEEDLEKLFEPYQRLSARPTAGEVSTGLGLSIVKQLCDRLDIDVLVENTSSGSRISLQFPSN